MAQFLVGIWLFPLGFVGLLNLWKLDVSRRRATLKYRFSGSGQAAFDAINNCLGRLSNSQQVLMLTGYRHFEDTRYSGGASRLPEFRETRLDRRSPPLIDIDSPVWHIRSDRRDLYFMPDHLMIYDGANIGGLSYSNLELRSAVDATQARETAKHTSDCKVVGTTYRFVNNDGSPDQRFNNNVDIPIVEYGVFSLAGSGLDLRLYASSQPAGTSVAQGFEAMQHLASKPVVKVAERRRQEAGQHRKTESIFIVLLNALCCVMAADGRLSSSEKKRLLEIMNQVKAPLDREKVNGHLAQFVERVKEGGVTSVVKSTCDELQLFKREGKTKTLFSCLNSLAEADGVVADAERKVIERFRVAVGE